MSVADAVLRRALPLGAYRQTRFQWRTAVSWFDPAFPSVDTYAGEAKIESRLRNVNVIAPTDYCRVMTEFGSDKGWDKHNYTTVYSALFRDWAGKPLRIFEIGLGSGNPDIPFTMGPNAAPGASLRGWRALFPRASVFGADIDRAVLFEEDRIQTFYCDQLDPAVIRELWLRPELREGADIILDDGLHTFEGNTTFLEGSLAHLRPGGIFIVEDIHAGTFPAWRARCENVYARQFPGKEFAMVSLPNPRNPLQNNLLIVS